MKLKLRLLLVSCALALVSVSAASAQSRPKLVANVTAKASASHSVVAAWLWAQGTGDAASGFHVWRAATCAGITIPGTPYATVTPSTTLTYTDTVVTAGSSYCYAVTAYNATGDSASTNQVLVAIPLAVPNAPSGLTLTPQ